MPNGSAPGRSFHATSFTSASIIGLGTSAPGPKFPMAAMPTVSALNPFVCAPSTDRPAPPARPS